MVKNVQDKLLMPEFTIDTVINDSGVEIPGIKRMYDIALAIGDSLMQWGGPGCIAGDAVIRGHWNGKTKYDDRKGVKIENIYKHQHGIKYLGSHQIKSTEFLVRSLNEKTGLIEETKVYSTFSGEKQCYLVTTENHTVEVTEEHPFLTQRGWVECKDLKEGDVLTVYPNTSKGLVRTSASSTVTEKLVSVVKTEVKKTYDLTCEANHNFFANGILVHNCGKSQSVQQWNADKVAEYEKRIAEGEKVKPWNPVVCDVRLSMKEPVDMVGVPIPTKDEKGNMTTVWATPSMWPKNDGEFAGGVIHLDEMNQGQAAILNAAFQLIQDRALGEYKVPEGYIIIGSSNPSAYNSTVTEFSVPLSNRFSHFNVKPDFDSWLNYRMNNGGNLDVMTFLKTQGMNMLFDREGMEAKVGSLAEAMYTDIVITPRSWEVIEKVLALPDGNKATGGFTIDEKQRYATGRLGLAVASRLFTWLKDKAKYQDWREILIDGKDFRDENSEQFWAVQMACMNAIINQKDDAKCREYCLNFVKATEKLKTAAFKVINITQLIRCKRVEGNLKVFNSMRDAPNLIRLISTIIRR